MKNHSWVQARESLGRGDGDAVGDVLVVFFGHSGGAGAEAEEAGVEIL